MGAGGTNRNQNCRELSLDRATVPQSLQLKWMWQTAFFPSPLKHLAGPLIEDHQPHLSLSTGALSEGTESHVDFLPSSKAESHSEPALWLQKELTFSAAAKVWLSRTVGAINFSASPFVFTPGKIRIDFCSGRVLPGMRGLLDAGDLHFATFDINVTQFWGWGGKTIDASQFFLWWVF